MNDELRAYEEVKVDIPCEFKDYYKEKYSIKWSPNDASWVTF